jgi:hypothetical protein
MLHLDRGLCSVVDNPSQKSSVHTLCVELRSE